MDEKGTSVQLSLWWLGFILLLMIIICAFFSGSEIGVMSLNRYRLRHLVKKKHKQAIRINTLLSQPDRLLGVVLIGSTLANITASMVATFIGQRLYGGAGVAIAEILLTMIILVFSEMTPKTLAAIYPQQVAFACSLPLVWLQSLVSPLITLISWMSNRILLFFGVSLNQAQKESLSREELRSVVHEAGGLLPIEHKSMLISLIDLEQAHVEDIMVPKSEIVGIDLEQPWHELLEQLETAQHTRLPLYRSSVDDLVGIVHLRNVLNLLLEDQLDMDALLSIAEQPYFVPEGTPLNIQILQFRRMKRRSCFVVNEYGDLLGLTTMEDILEEIVGEFTTDIAALSKDITPQENGSFIIDASITLRNLNRLLSWHLPTIGPRTLSGLIIEYLGYIPPADCCLIVENYQIEVLKVSDNMIKSVRILKRGKNRKN